MKLSGTGAKNWLSAPAEKILSNNLSDTLFLGVLFYGPDSGLVSERASMIIKKLSDNPDNPFAITSLDADDLIGDNARLADEMMAQSLLGDTRLIKLRLSHEKSGAMIGRIIKDLDARPEICAAKIIVEAGDLNPRSSVRKAFEGAKNFIAIACYEDSQRDIANMVRDILGGYGIRIENEALNILTPLLAGDRRLARSEIEKLALYKGSGKEADATINKLVTVADIKAIISGAGADGIDDIVFATLLGQVNNMDEILRRALAGKTSPHAILAALSRQIVRLHQAKSQMTQGVSADEAMRALRPPVFIMRKNDFGQALRIWNTSALERAIAQSIETEKSMKSTGSASEALLGRLLLALAVYASKRK